MDWFNLSLTLPVTDPTWIFLLVLLIILFAPILLNKLRIPHIIGMILKHRFLPIYDLHEFQLLSGSQNHHQRTGTYQLYLWNDQLL